MSGYEEFLAQWLCKHCSVAVLEPHPTLHNWGKCPICGYCVEIKKKKHNEKRH